jgi:hypothetical protein
VAGRAYTFGLTQHAVADGFAPFLKAVRSASDSAALDYGPIEDLVSFAEEAYPDVRQLPEWRAMAAGKKTIGRGRLTRNPYWLVQDAARRGQAKARRWRWERIEH